MAKRKQHTAEAKQSRLWTPVFVSIVLLTLCCFIVGQGLNAGTSVYLAYRGETAALAGIGAAAFSAAAAASRIVFGPFADVRGRVIVITIGSVILLAGTAGAAVFSDLSLFVLWRLLQGAGFAAVTTAAATAAADVLPAERLGEGIGYYGLGQAIAMSIGPALAIFLVSTDPAENLFRGLSISAAAVFLISFCCHYEYKPERLPETSTYRRIAKQRAEQEQKQRKDAGVSTIAGDSAEAEAGSAASTDGGTDISAAVGAKAATSARADAHARSNAEPDATARKGATGGFFHRIFEPGALAGALPMMVICPTFGFGIYFTGLLGTKLGVANAGLFYTVSAVAMILIRLSSRTFMDRTPAIRLHAASALAGIVFCAMLVAAEQIAAGNAARDALFYLAGIPYGLCLGMALPVNQTVSVKNSPPERWGAANGLFLLLNDVGIGIAAIVWGVTNDLLGFTATLGFVALLVFASVIVAWFTYPASEKR